MKPIRIRETSAAIPTGRDRAVLRADGGGPPTQPGRENCCITLSSINGQSMITILKNEPKISKELNGLVFAPLATAAKLEEKCARSSAKHLPCQVPAPDRTVPGRPHSCGAYLSANFQLHAVMSLIAGVFEHHDRSQFECTASPLAPARARRDRLEGPFEHFIDGSSCVTAKSTLPMGFTAGCILRRVDGSVLWLLVSNGAAKRNGRWKLRSFSTLRGRPSGNLLPTEVQAAQ